MQRDDSTKNSATFEAGKRLKESPNIDDFQNSTKILNIPGLDSHKLLVLSAVFRKMLEN